jgi:chromatin remodeling complex protein RSC6
MRSNDDDRKSLEKLVITLSHLLETLIGSQDEINTPRMRESLQTALMEFEQYVESHNFTERSVHLYFIIPER